jgi:hypothetical protein
MFEKALIDGDIVTYRCAAATENDDVNIACWQAGEMMRRILHETNAVGCHCFLSGSNNFRYGLYPDYKANRRDVPKPRHYAAIREYLCSNWNASVTDGHEADDAMGVAQMNEEGTIICSIDKDMLMIPGWHYNFVKQEQRLVSPLEGLRHLYWQAIMGDKVDNIPGFDGLMRSKVPKKMEWMIEHLSEMTDERDMYQFVFDHHTAEVPLDVCLKCLWIWRKENDIWKNPNQACLDRGEEESIHYLDDKVGLTEVATEVRDIEGSSPREESK